MFCRLKNGLMVSFSTIETFVIKLQFPKLEPLLTQLCVPAANFPDYEIDHDTVDLLLDFVPGMQFAWLISLARVGKDGKEVHGLLLMLRLKLFNHLFPSARGRPIRSLRDQRPWNCLEALMRWTCRDRQQQGTLPNPQPNPGLCLVWRETWNLFLQWAPGDYTPQTAKSSKEVEQTGATSYGTLPTDKTLPRTARRELDRRAVCRTVIAAIDKGLQSVFYPPVPTHTVNVAPVEDEHSKLPLDDCAVYSDGDDTVAEGGEMRSFFPPLIRARARTHVEEPVFELVSRRSLVKRAEAYVHRMLGATETAQNC